MIRTCTLGVIRHVSRERDTYQRVKRPSVAWKVRLKLKAHKLLEGRRQPIPSITGRDAGCDPTSQTASACWWVVVS